MFSFQTVFNILLNWKQCTTVKVYLAVKAA